MHNSTYSPSKEEKRKKNESTPRDKSKQTRSIHGKSEMTVLKWKNVNIYEILSSNETEEYNSHTEIEKKAKNPTQRKQIQQKIPLTEKNEEESRTKRTEMQSREIPRGILQMQSRKDPNRIPKKVRFKFTNKSKNRRGNRYKKDKHIRVFYANANGIKGKIESLQTAVKEHKSHVVAIAETKQNPPRLEGYGKWYMINRKSKGGGGVAITVRCDIENNTTETQCREDDDQEVAWIRIEVSHRRYLHIGVYYGQQENAHIEEVERQYQMLDSQISRLRATGNIILVGDFNAKLKVDRSDANQQISRNGKFLEELMTTHNMTAISINADRGIWTRVNRNNPNEKSIIDYILVDDHMREQNTEMIVDEEGTHRLKGKKQTDHNTLMATFKSTIKIRKEKIKRWKLNNTEGWKQFNEQLVEANRESRISTYKGLEEKMVEIMKKTVGETTITTGNTKTKESEQIKNLRSEKRIARKEYNEARHSKNPEIHQKLNKYVQSQIKLKQAIEEEGRRTAIEKLRKLKEHGGSKSRDFWRIRKQILNKGKKEEYDTIDEEGQIIKDPEEAKEHIATYYEQLYKAREGKPEYAQWTNHITEQVKTIEKEMKGKPKPPQVTGKELKDTIKNLKKGKSTGPDNIPNEAFIYASEETTDIYRSIINKQITEVEVPEKWQEGELIRFYKGKGEKGRCSNERGITLASNFGKLVERIVNERAKTQINISEAQAGGKKGSATVDHIITLKEAINNERNKKKPVYVIFLDVTKAYDKAWLDAIMYVMYKEGLRNNNWSMIRKLNENLTAKINTKHGQTRTIKITDSIRQGGVLSVIQYAILMDEFAKEIKARDMGADVQQIGETIGCLLWVDDVALITSDKEEMQRMLNIVDDIAKRYHIEFGKDKSKALKIGGKPENSTFKLGDMEIEYTNKYKYLGCIQNDKNNMKDHIAEVKGKAEAAYQTVMTVAGDMAFRNMEMETIWETVESCIVSVITYGIEALQPNKGETKELNRILDNILKRILMVPTTTPREALYIETGLLDIEATIQKNTVNTENRIRKGQNKYMQKIIKIDQKGSWKKHNDEIKQKSGIQEDDMEQKRNRTKGKVHEKIANAFKNRIESSGEDKSKVKHLIEGKGEWKPNRRQKYMSRLTRMEVSVIFKARTRMLDVKDNFRNKYRDDICRKCRVEKETQKHVLDECPGIHETDMSRVAKEDIFSDDVHKLKETAEKIHKIMQTIDDSAAPHNGVSYSGI